MYLIGLTGNIATGKSTVRQILEQLGARVVDADLVAQAVLRRGTPAWGAVVDRFGYDILRYDGTVDRQKLGALVFNDPAKLRALEQITHPAVGTELALMVRDALAQPDASDTIMVIEAVKLYEAGLTQYLDALWVVTAPSEEQKRRLMQERGLRQDEADARLRAQPPLDEKLKRATVVIDNGGSIEETRVQVMRAFIAIHPARGADKTPLLQHWLHLPAPNVEQSAVRAINPVAAPTVPPAESVPAAVKTATLSEPEWTVRRSGPGDARALAELLARIEGRAAPLSREELLARQGKLGYWLVRAGSQTVALAAWQAENLAAIVRELWVRDDAAAARAVPLLLDAIEPEANALTCEVVVILAPPTLSDAMRRALTARGYTLTAPDELHRLWRGVVEPLMAREELLYAKRLREMVTKPI